jgi:hypothetical protein
MRHVDGEPGRVFYRLRVVLIATTKCRVVAASGRCRNTGQEHVEAGWQIVHRIGILVGVRVKPMCQ